MPVTALDHLVLLTKVHFQGESCNMSLGDPADSWLQ